MTPRSSTDAYGRREGGRYRAASATALRPPPCPEPRRHDRARGLARPARTTLHDRRCGGRDRRAAAVRARARAAVEAFGAAGDEGERVALADVGRVVRAVHEARLAASAEAQRLAAGQRARQGARLKP